LRLLRVTQSINQKWNQNSEVNNLTKNEDKMNDVEITMQKQNDALKQ